MPTEPTHPKPRRRATRRPSKTGKLMEHVSLRVKAWTGVAVAVLGMVVGVLAFDRNYAKADDVKDIKKLLILQGVQSEIIWLESREKTIEDKKFDLTGKRANARGKLSVSDQTMLDRSESELAKVRADVASKKRMVEAIQLQK